MADRGRDGKRERGRDKERRIGKRREKDREEKGR